MLTLRIGSQGPAVVSLQQALRERGFSPGAIDGDFGPGTEAAVLAFQRTEDLLADGIVGPRTAAALGLADVPRMPSVVPNVTVTVAAQMFPGALVRNIQRHLPIVLEALVAPQLTDKPMVLMALATIRAETAGFVPVDELPSRFNTSPGGRPFDLYDHRRDLGNQGPPDGERYRGRGFIQLTGRSNYERHGAAIGVSDLARNPERANEPELAARLLASFLKGSERRIKEALLRDDLQAARRAVNGGSHGLEAFSEAFRTGQRLVPDAEVAPV